tara:strand:+ start:578 stop:913 length:336 start_codon:yes stop_codon:yes gene_type:complete
MESGAMVAALVMISEVVIGKVVTSRLLGFMHSQIADVQKNKHEILRHVKSAESQRKVAEQNKGKLERKKTKIEGKRSRMKQELDALRVELERNRMKSDATRGKSMRKTRVS